MYAGAIFVTMPANAAAVETEECGDLATAPCYSIKTAVQKASDGSTIYVAPGTVSRMYCNCYSTA